MENFSVETCSKQLIEAVQLAQQNGKYTLDQSSKILNAVNFFTKGTTNDIVKDDLSSFQLLINAVEVAQSRGAFTLEESHELFKTCLQIVEWSKTKKVEEVNDEPCSSKSCCK